MKILRSRIIKLLMIAFLVGFILGIISFIITNKKEISSETINYINLIKNGKFNYLISLYYSIKSNIKISFIIWIFVI